MLRQMTRVEKVHKHCHIDRKLVNKAIKNAYLYCSDRTLTLIPKIKKTEKKKEDKINAKPLVINDATSCSGSSICHSSVFRRDVEDLASAEYSAVISDTLQEYEFKCQCGSEWQFCKRLWGKDIRFKAEFGCDWALNFNRFF